MHCSGASRDREQQSIKLERLALTVSRFEAFLWQQSFVGEAEQKVMLRETLVRSTSPAGFVGQGHGHAAVRRDAGVSGAPVFRSG